MTKSGKLAKRNILAKRSEMDDMFDGFRREIAAMMSAWQGLNLGNMRIPLCDLADKGDRYQIHVEVPGIDKDKIEVKATGNTVEISGKSEEKRGGYLYSERSARSFYRRIPVPEEIKPSKVSADMNNGVLTVRLPKAEEGASRQAMKVPVK
jgi:HSP20 family protein